MVRLLEWPATPLWVTADNIVLQVPDEARLPADPHTIGHYCCKLRLSSIGLTQWYLMAGRTQVLFATGDVMCQQAVERKGLDKQDLSRTGRMALYGGGTPFTSALQPTILSVLLVLIAPLFQSCFWPRCNPLVQVPATAYHSQIRERYHRRPSPGRSDRLRLDQFVPFSQQYGIYGGYRSQGEAEQHILDGFAEELDGVAGGAGD